MWNINRSYAHIYNEGGTNFHLQCLYNVELGFTYMIQTVHHLGGTNQTDKNLDFPAIGMLKRISLLLNRNLKHLNT